MTSLVCKFVKSSKPILESLNTQSLLSKHSDLKNFLTELSINKIPLHILALQATWTIHHPHLVNIPGFKFIHHQRNKMRSGGVGLYIKDNLSLTIVEEYSTIIPKIFECLSIEKSINNKTTVFSSIYRSPSSKAEDFHAFVTHLDSMLFNFSSKNISAYICLRVGHRVLFRSERIVLLHSFKECNVLLRSFFEFLATYETQLNDAFFCVLFLRT